MRRVGLRAVSAAVVTFLALTGCSVATADGGYSDLRLMVPNSPGGGYDTTARLMAEDLHESGITARVDVFNLQGASGAVGLARMKKEAGNADLLMMMGLGVVGAVSTTHPTVTLDDVTPIARLITEPEIIVVPDSSPYDSLKDLLHQWRKSPRSVRIGGGSAAGGPDFLATYLLAEALSIDAQDVSYTRYDGGGPLLAALLTGEVDVAVSGVAEYTEQIGAGPVDVLAVTSREELPHLHARTLKAQGVDFSFANWRGVVAPPGLSKGEVGDLRRLVDRLHGTPEWRRTVRVNGWTDAYLESEGFGRFLSRQSRHVSHTLADLGVDRSE